MQSRKIDECFRRFSKKRLNCEETEIKIRYNETDQMGIVYHTNYIVWFNVVRDEFMLKKLDIRIHEWEKKAIFSPVVEVYCYYKKPLKYGETIVAQCMAFYERIPRIRMAYRIVNKKGGDIHALGETVSVLVDKNGKLLMQYPEEMVPLLKNFEEYAEKKSG